MLRAAGAGLAAAVVAAAAPAAAGLFNPQAFTLENGMEVVVISDHRAPLVTHMVWYKAGAADEPPGKSGIAHFLEHLMFKGTGAAPAGEFSTVVARHGGRENAFTTQDYTAYFQTVAVAQLEMVMRLEADRMVNLTLTDEQVETERDVILEERRSRTDNAPEALLGEQMSAALFLAHPYGVPVIGWEHEMRTLDRGDALAFYRAHYTPQNAILVVAGDVTADTVRVLAEATYGVIPARAIEARRRPQEPPHRAARRIEYRDERVARPSWSRRYIAPSRNRGESEHALPLMLLSDILGGGTTSRLYRALVVEGQIAAHAGSYYGGGALDLDSFSLYAVPPAEGGIAAMETAVDDVIAALLDEGVNAEELERAKTGAVASAIYARDDVQGTARIFGRGLATGLTPHDIETWPERISAVTVEQVNAAARFVLNPAGSVTGVLLPAEPG
jgi:zinc protease